MNTFDQLAITVTPAMARAWLADGAPNRPLSRSYVTKLARAMQQGDWHPSNDAIVLNSQGYLTNGQHRLNAIIIANRPVDLLVVSGIDTPVMDTGRKRSNADILALQGTVNSRSVAAAIAQLWRYEKGFLGDHGRTPTPDETIRLLEEHPGIMDSVRRTHKLQHMMASSVITFVHYKASLVDKQKADEFIDKLYTGEGLSIGHPALTLRNRISTLRGPHKAIRNVDLLKISIKAWNAFFNGRAITTLPIRENEAFPRFIGD